MSFNSLVLNHSQRAVHTYPDIFESATFSFRIQKFPRPHVAYSIEFARPYVSDGIRIHSSTQGSSALKCLQSMRLRARWWRKICSVRPKTCFQVNRHFGDCSVRD